MTTYSENDELPFLLVRPRSSRRGVAASASSAVPGRVSPDVGKRPSGRSDDPAPPDSIRGEWFARGAQLELEEDDGTPDESATVRDGLYPEDRLSPGVAGGLMGALGATAALAVFQAMAPAMMEDRMARVAAVRGVEVAVAFALAYGSVAALGGLVGTAFAIVTRFLRKWLALLVWALVFFVSVAVLALAATTNPHGYVTGVSSALAQPVLLASAVFAALVSFSLPIRRRR